MDNIEKHNSNELYHYGRLGQKWGRHIFGDIKKSSIEYMKKKKKEKDIIRNTKIKIKKLKQEAREDFKKQKFKNKQEQKIENAKQYILDKYGIDYRKNNENNNKPAIKNNKLTKKQIHNISDNELRDRQMRLQNEKNLMELQNYHASTGKKIANTAIQDIAISGAVNAGRDLTTTYLKKYGDIGLKTLVRGLNIKRKK